MADSMVDIFIGISDDFQGMTSTIQVSAESGLKEHVGHS
jgi:hypothetical protein